MVVVELFLSFFFPDFGDFLFFALVGESTSLNSSSSVDMKS